MCLLLKRNSIGAGIGIADISIGVGVSPISVSVLISPISVLVSVLGHVPVLGVRVLVVFGMVQS